MNESRLMRQFGLNVRRAREQRRLRQEDLAEKIGLRRTSITNIELGNQCPNLYTLYQIAEVLGVKPWALMPGYDGAELAPVPSETNELHDLIKRVVAKAREERHNEPPGKENLST